MSTRRVALAAFPGGWSCGNGTWFLGASLHPHPSWSGVISASGRLVLGQRAEGGGRRAWLLTLLWEPVLQRKGLSDPSSRLDSHRPRLQNTPPVRSGAASASPLVSLPRGGGVYG